VAEAWGAILRFLGAVLNGIYNVIPSYGLAIIVLTLLVRVVLIPLTVKQIRSMSAMQKLQPELKRLQQKYKGDRQKLNEEMMKLYREHGVNPLGGCFPLLMQAPVFIALYSVLRAAVPFDAALATPVTAPPDIASRSTICAPVGTPSLSGEGFTDVVCRKDGKEIGTFKIGTAKEHQGTKTLDRIPSTVTRCGAQVDTAASPDQVTGFRCLTPVGTGHLPRDGKLFEAIVEDKATFLGMHLACSPTQASSKTAIRQCTATGKAAGAGLVGYYLLVALMMGSTYYQQRQMASKATGPQAKQMQMMGRIMPLFLGFISLNIPAGVTVYWTVSNVWTIGQQYFFLQRQDPTGAPGNGPPGGKPGGKPGPSAQSKPKRKR
jgi:YidC/Oxa1 family membrane protein insertase